MTTGMVGFDRNCKVDERFDSALIYSCCCCDISVGIGCISLWVYSSRPSKRIQQMFVYQSRLIWF